MPGGWPARGAALRLRGHTEPKRAVRDLLERSGRQPMRSEPCRTQGAIITLGPEAAAVDHPTATGGTVIRGPDTSGRSGGQGS